MTNSEFKNLFKNNIFYKAKKNFFVFNGETQKFEKIQDKNKITEILQDIETNSDYIRIKRYNDSMFFINKVFLNKYIDIKMSESKFDDKHEFFYVNFKNEVVLWNGINIDIKLSIDEFLDAIDNPELKKYAEKFLIIENLKFTKWAVETVNLPCNSTVTANKYFNPLRPKIEAAYKASLENVINNEKGIFSETEINNFKMLGIL